MSHQHRQAALSPYTTRQLYDLVMDVERYPQFLPWCGAARVLSRAGNETAAELVIVFKGLRETYASRIIATPPSDDHAPAAIDVAAVRGPFEHLVNRWHFTPADPSGTIIEFFLDFKFKSRLLDALIGGFFERAAEKMVGAFEKRADALYGIRPEI